VSLSCGKSKKLSPAPNLKGKTIGGTSRIRKNQLDATGIDVYSHYVNSACFGHCVKVGIPTFTQCTQLVSQLGTTAANTTRYIPHAVVYIVCSPDDGHNDARNMLS